MQGRIQELKGDGPKLNICSAKILPFVIPTLVYFGYKGLEAQMGRREASIRVALKGSREGICSARSIEEK